MFSKKEFAIVSNLRFISKTDFLLSWVEHKKYFITLGPEKIKNFIFFVISYLSSWLPNFPMQWVWVVWILNKSSISYDFISFNNVSGDISIY